MSLGGTGLALVVAFIGVGGSVLGGLVARPKDPVPVTNASTTTTRTAETVETGATRETTTTVHVPSGKLKISRAFWWGLAAVLVSASFAAAWLCAVIGIYFGVRDIRSPGTRRWVTWGLALCALAFVIAAANPKSGFSQGFIQGYNQSK
jgi:hypothetical protein